MAITELLQDFGSALPGAEPLALVSESEQEAQSIASYERGYAAGWEDALTLQIAEKSKLSDALRSNLEDLDFTVAEARQQMLTGFAPVFETIVDKVLPDVLREVVGPLLSEEFNRLAETAGNGAMQLAVAPGTAAQVRPIVSHAVGGHLTVVEDPTLSGEQLSLRMAETDLLLDPHSLIAEIRQAVSGFTHAMNSEVQHG